MIYTSLKMTFTRKHGYGPVRGGPLREHNRYTPPYELFTEWLTTKAPTTKAHPTKTPPPEESPTKKKMDRPIPSKKA